MNALPLSSFHIARFRGLRDLKLEGLGRINLLVGANNAGKTSTLDALSLFCRPLDLANWRETARRRDVKSSRTPESEPFKWLFPQFATSNDSAPHRIWLEGTGAYAGRKVISTYDEFEEFGQERLQNSDPEDAEEDNEPDCGLKIHIQANYAQRINGKLLPTADGQNTAELRIVDNQRNTYSTAVEDPSIAAAFISPHSHRTTQDTSWYYGRAIEQEEIDETFTADVLEVMQRIDKDVIEINAASKGKTGISISVKHRLTGRTPIHAFGDGFQRALLIAASIPAVRNGVLLIDELESALHVSVLDSVLSVLKWAAEKYNVQVFATTHSLEAVDSVLAAFKNDLPTLAAYRLERENGVIAKRFSGGALQDLRTVLGQEIR